MEASCAATTLAVFTISKALNHGFTSKCHSLLSARLVTRPFGTIPAQYNATAFLSAATLPRNLRALSSVLPLLRQRLEYFPISAASFATSGGGGNGEGGDAGGGGGGGGGGGSDGGDVKSNLAGVCSEEGSVLSSDVIILDVGGMTCGGCAASVKRILENQPQVSSASVNLTTETAIVWPISEAKVVPDWQKQLGEALSKHLTSCGFMSNPRGQEAVDGEN